MNDRKPHSPYRVDTLIEFLRRFPHPMGERVTAPDRVSRLFESSEGERIVVSLSAGGSKVLSDRPLPPDVLEKVHHVFEFDSPIRKRLKEHPNGHWLGRAAELPVLRWDDSFAALISTVIEQQTSWRNALKSIDLAFRLSRRRVGALALFPEPREFLENSELLEGMPITFRRKDLIRDFARRFLDDPDSIDRLCTSMEDAESKLIGIKGVGPWTARVFLSKRFGYRRSVPTNDVALQRAAAHFLSGEKRKMAEDELAERLSAFGTLSGEAAHRLLIRWVLETYPTSV